MNRLDRDTAIYNEFLLSALAVLAALAGLLEELIVWGVIQ